VNLDAVPLPDLATAGERAVDAARARAPLGLGAPRDDLKGFHDAIVALVRDVLVREAYERVDVEIVVNLAAGMTALIPEPVPAIAQVVHRLGLIAETLGWARPGWIEAVSNFRRGPKIQPPGTSALARRVPSEPSEANTGHASAASPTSESISLVVPPPRRRTPIPDLDLSDGLRARLTWLAVDTGQSVEETLTTLLDFFLRWRNAKRTIETLAAILRLGDQLDLAQVDVEELADYLKAREALRKAGCDIDDVPEALRLITLLQALPVAWTWDDAEVARQAVAAILETDLSLGEVKEFLEQHRGLEALGFDEATAVAVAEALTRAGVRLTACAWQGRARGGSTPPRGGQSHCGRLPREGAGEQWQQ